MFVASERKTAGRAPKANAVRFALRSLALLWICAAPTACAHPARLSPYGYTRRPMGYHWVGVRLPEVDGRASAVTYYGVDPSNGWTVYVGPDGIYYTFNHSGRITPGDLHSYWRPHDSSATASRPAPK